MSSDTFNGLMNEAIKRSGISDAELAEQLGFKASNMVTMIRQGVLRLPVDKVFPLLGILDVDALKLFGLFLKEYRGGAVEFTLHPDKPENPDVAFALRMSFYPAALKRTTLSAETKAVLQYVLDLMNVEAPKST